MADYDLDFGNGAKNSFDGSLESLQRYIDDIGRTRLADRTTLLAEAVKPLLPLCQAEAKRLGTPDIVYKRAWKALELVDGLQVAVTSNAGWMPDGHDGVLWRHNEKYPDFPKQSFDSLGVHKKQLQAASAKYLTMSWLSDGHLDRIIIDALARLELVEFDFSVDGGHFDVAAFTSNRLVKWLINDAGLAYIVEAAIVGWVWHGYATGSAYWHDWAGAGVLYYVVVAVLWIRKIKRNRQLIAAHRDHMQKLGQLKIVLRKSYRELRGPVLRPTRVRDEFRAAEAAGVT